MLGPGDLHPLDLTSDIRNRARRNDPGIRRSVGGFRRGHLQESPVYGNRANGVMARLSCSDMTQSPVSQGRLQQLTHIYDSDKLYIQ
jgi:hypothetical protein